MMFKGLSTYFNRKNMLLDIQLMLKIPDNERMNRYPNLCYEYKIDDNVLKLILPSIETYLFSRLTEVLIITYDKTTREISFSNNQYDIITSGDCTKLRKILDIVYEDLTERDAFKKFISEERERMAKFVDPRHRTHSHGSTDNPKDSKHSESKRDKDGSVYRDIVYSAFESSSSHDSSGSNSHGGSHSHHDT
jgi:hypothetical protein